MASTVLPGAEGANCLTLAQRAWQYAQKRRHDRRTLFLGAELHAALELRQAGSRLVSPRDILELAEALEGRQDQGSRKDDLLAAAAPSGPPAAVVLS
jgi:hypothetical protein